MVRFALPLFIRRWGLAVASVLLITIGLIWGITSHSVDYQNYAPNANYTISAGLQSGNVYLNKDGSSDYFAAFKNDFPAAIAASDLDQQAIVSFVARTDSSTLSPTLNTGSATINDAHRIEKLVLYDQNGNIIKTYTSAEYDANPNGFYVNNWLIASLLLLAGLLLAAWDLIYPRLMKKPQISASFDISANGAQQYAQQCPPKQ